MTKETKSTNGNSNQLTLEEYTTIIQILTVVGSSNLLSPKDYAVAVQPLIEKLSGIVSEASE